MADDEAVLGTGASGDPNNPGLTQQEVDEDVDKSQVTPAPPPPPMPPPPPPKPTEVTPDA